MFRVSEGADGAPEKTGPRPFARPSLLNGQGPRVFFAIPCHSPRLGPRPPHTPDWFPPKIGSNKWGPVEAMSGGRPRAKARRGLPSKYPPGPL